MQKWLICAVLSLGFAGKAFAQDDYDAKVKAYIDKYKYLAVAEQKRSGIPAAITLAQGIHETQAGCSELATLANNHFGIKCKKEWTGETFAHTDDAPNECFRKYGKSEDSYRDHTDYLVKSPRYAELFKLSITDYPSWALGLRKCGYATNPRYAQVLIKLVEDYHLQEFTYAAMNNAEIIPDKDPVMVPPTKSKPEVTSTPASATPPVTKAVEAPATKTVEVTDAPVTTVAKQPEPIPVPTATIPADVPVTTPPVNVAVVEPDAVPAVGEAVKEPVTAPVTKTVAIAEPDIIPRQEGGRPIYGKEVKANGLKAIYGHRGETPLGYAYNAGIRYSKLLDINEIDERPLPVDMYLYLEKKHTTGVRPTHTVKTGETLFMVAQAEGMQIKSLMELNLLTQGEEPLPGTVLQLQQQATEKPAFSTAIVTRKGISTTRIKTSSSAAPSMQEVNPVAKTTVRNKDNKASADYVSTQPDKHDAAGPAIEEVNVVKPEPVQVKTVMQPEVIEKAAAPTASSVADPTQEEAKGYPKVAESRYMIPTETAKEETKPIKDAAVQVAVDANPDAPEAASAVPVPKQDIIATKTTAVTEMPKATEPVKETTLPITEQPEAITTTSIKEKTNNIVAVSPKPVAVPAIEEEPKDELDKLKRKFDRVVYADGNKASAAVTEPVAAPVAKAEVPKPVAVAETKPSAKPEINTVIDPKDEAKYYTVRKGDTGFNIARKNNITLTQLMKWNNMDFGNVEIKEGQRLKVKP